MPVNFSEFMKKMGTLNAYTPGATTNSSPSSKLSIAKPGGTGTTRPPVSPNPAAPTPTRAGTVSEREVYGDSVRFKQEEQRLKRDTLNTGAALENAKLALSRTQSAAQIQATNKANDRAYDLAMKQFHQGKVESARNNALAQGQLKLENRKVESGEAVSLAGIRSNEKLGMAKNATERYAIDTGFKTAQMTDSTNRFKIGKDFDLGKLTLESNERIKSADRIVQERTGRNSNMTSLIANWGV